MSTFLSFEYTGAEILAGIDKRIEELKKQQKKAVQEADETYIRKLEEYMHEYIRMDTNLKNQNLPSYIYEKKSDLQKYLRCRGEWYKSAHRIIPAHINGKEVGYMLQVKTKVNGKRDDYKEVPTQ